MQETYSKVEKPKRVKIEWLNQTLALLKSCRQWDYFRAWSQRKRFTVSRNDWRFVVIRKPHFKTFLYAIIDLEEQRMWPRDGLFYTPDIRTPDGIEELMSEIFTKHWTIVGSWKLNTRISKRNWRKIFAFDSYQQNRKGKPLNRVNRPDLFA